MEPAMKPKCQRHPFFFFCRKILALRVMHELTDKLQLFIFQREIKGEQFGFFVLTLSFTPYQTFIFFEILFKIRNQNKILRKKVK